MNYTTEIIASTPDEGLFKPIIALQGQSQRDSRNGPTIEFPGVATIVWTHPLQRVMFDEVRDCNPSFALFESLWMLGGRQDLASIVYFNSKFGQYSDDGKFIRGSAYGVRWWTWFGHNQIDAAVARAKNEGLDTRRMVIMQWDAATDAVTDSKDVPCNAMCCLLMRDGALDLTVFNRSNDAIFGAAGSNIVHFSMLLEYVAKMLDVPVGKYFQTSNCFHGYTEFPIYKKIAPAILSGKETRQDYQQESVLLSPMFMGEASKEDFDADVKFLLDSHAGVVEINSKVGLPELEDEKYRTEFFRKVVLPMMRSWKIWKETKNPAEAMTPLRDLVVDNPQPYDWHLAGYEWLQRRAENQAKKGAASE